MRCILSIELIISGRRISILFYDTLFGRYMRSCSRINIQVTLFTWEKTAVDSCLITDNFFPCRLEKSIKQPSKKSYKTSNFQGVTRQYCSKGLPYHETTIRKSFSLGQWTTSRLFSHLPNRFPRITQRIQRKSSSAHPWAETTTQKGFAIFSYGRVETAIYFRGFSIICPSKFLKQLKDSRWMQ